MGQQSVSDDETLINHCRGSQADPGITAIVPAYNEAGRIGAVVSVLCQVDCLKEILVVDDGSKDGTAEDALQAARCDSRLRLLRMNGNRGKGEAVFAGWSTIETSFTVMLDADLIHLTPAHVIQLLEPVVEGEADMSLGIFKQGYWRTDLSHRLTPWLSGQRALRSELFSYISQDAAHGYGLETAMSLAARHHSWRVSHVPLLGVSHPLGEIPRGGYHGLQLKVRMYTEIGRAWMRANRNGKR